MDNNGSIFTSVKKKRQKRSSFNLSHDVKLSLDMAKLCPSLVQECVPGDKFTFNSTAMLRMAPLVSPVMHKINVYMEYFFVPNRIVWGNWETFITGSRNGKQLPSEELPSFPIVQPYDDAKMLNGNGSLSDYMGIPTPGSFSEMGPGAFALSVNALPYAAYQRIYDEYYRDENLMTSLYDVDTFENYNQLPDGSIPAELQQQLGAIRIRAWEHDYFTSALPWAQKGEEVRIPVSMEFNNDGDTLLVDQLPNDGHEFAQNQILKNTQGGPGPVNISANDSTTSTSFRVNIDNTQNLESAGTINDLRAAIKLQEWLETNARGGSRYFESIYAHFGVKSPDSRLQRPEYIGSNKSNMIISEVLQTSSPQADGDTPQGNMSGHGQNISSSKNFTYYAQEHGFIIGIISVLPKTAYFQGVEKHWLKYNDRLEYYFPEFAHLGEQEIQNQEIYFNMPTVGSDYDPLGTFGYTPRYAEYKFKNSRVAGDFRETLKYWHLGRDFETPPALNDTFIGANPSKRIYAVQDLPRDGEETGQPIRDYHSIYAHVFHDIKASRLMPKYGTPML